MVGFLGDGERNCARLCTDLRKDIVGRLAGIASSHNGEFRNERTITALLIFLARPRAAGIVGRDLERGQ